MFRVHTSIAHAEPKISTFLIQPITCWSKVFPTNPKSSPGYSNHSPSSSVLSPPTLFRTQMHRTKPKILFSVLHGSEIPCQIQIFTKPSETCSKIQGSSWLWWAATIPVPKNQSPSRTKLPTVTPYPRTKPTLSVEAAINPSSSTKPPKRPYNGTKFSSFCAKPA
jgi:hypothetical protein